MAAQAGRQAVVAALETRFTDLARKLRAELADASPEERMEAVMRALVEGGYMAEWRDGEGPEAHRAQLRHPRPGRALPRDL